MRSGGTTLVDITFPYPGWVEMMERSGMRSYAAPGFNTEAWYRANAHQLKYDEDIALGEKNFLAALDLIDELRKYPSGRGNGVVSPVQVDNNTDAMLQDSYAAAKERGIPWTTHASQSVVEFNIMVDRHGKTPIQYLADLDLLGRGTILGHAMLIDDNDWVGWHSKTDIKLLLSLIHI